jgi:small subunit ribosomal protein S20
MANIKSSIKRIKVTRRNNIQNKIYSSNIKTCTKKYYQTLERLKVSKSEENKVKVNQSLSLLVSRIDKAVKKNVLHHNTAARKKSKLMTDLNKIINT